MYLDLSGVLTPAGIRLTISLLPNEIAAAGRHLPSEPTPLTAFATAASPGPGAAQALAPGGLGCAAQLAPISNLETSRCKTSTSSRD